MYFSPKEYLLGDSAFTPGVTMVPPFKFIGGNLNSNLAAFNTMLAKPRVKSEHCIGILKGRIPFVKQIRLQFKNKTQYRKIINYVRGAVVLQS